MALCESVSCSTMPLTMNEECKDVCRGSLASMDSSRFGMTRAKSRYSLATESLQSSLASGETSASSLDNISVNEDFPSSFGRDLRRYTDSSPDSPILDSGLRKVLEPHLRKSRKQRELAKTRRLGGVQVQDSIAGSIGVPYVALRREVPFLFSGDTHPLSQILADCLNIRDLSLSHCVAEEDLLAPLLVPEVRLPFHIAYHNFVESFCIPFLHTIALSKGLFHSATTDRIVYRYQAFPHINISTPGSSAEVPTCCTSKGKSIGCVSFHVPLTPSFGTNALYTESHPGQEDWHPLKATSFGLGYVFDSSRCLHYTMENTTDSSRVSLDFSVLLYCEGEVSGGKDCRTGLCPPHLLEDSYSKAGPGFYNEVTVNMGAKQYHGMGIVQRNMKHHALLDPDYRVGRPFG